MNGNRLTCSYSDIAIDSLGDIRIAYRVDQRGRPIAPRIVHRFFDQTLTVMGEKVVSLTEAKQVGIIQDWTYRRLTQNRFSAAGRAHSRARRSDRVHSNGGYLS